MQALSCDPLLHARLINVLDTAHMWALHIAGQVKLAGATRKAHRVWILLDDALKCGLELLLHAWHIFDSLQLLYQHFPSLDIVHISRDTLLEQCSRPISFISNGQNVPEDIVDVAPRSLAELIMGEKDQ